MQVKATKRFHDIKADVIRKRGDVFSVTKARFDEIDAKVPGLVESLEKKPEDAEEQVAEEPAAEKPTKKTTSRRKTAE